MIDHLPEVRRLLGEGHGDRHIAGALGVTRHVARGLIVRTKLESLPPIDPMRPLGGALDLYKTACRALGEARDIVAVKDVADRAAALKEYARLANDRVLEINAAELRILSERKLGQMLESAKESGQVSRGQPPKKCADSEQFSRVTLDEAGIDRKLSSRAQKLASISERAMDARLATWREAAERGAARVTVNLLRDGDKKERRAARESHLGEMQATANLKLPNKRYGVILADPEWRFEPWSRETGLDRAADNHYPTSVTEVIAARPVHDIAAKDCALFLWATVPMLPHALAVMDAWGFDYRSHFIWAKDRLGTGYWNRNRHEVLLLGISGDVPAPAPGEQWHSLIEAAVGQHSVKPDWQYGLVEAYFPHIPKIELNARRSRPGWDSWGVDAPLGSVTGEVGEAAE